MREKIRNNSKSFWALILVLVMFLTNILGAVEVNAASIPAPTITEAFIGTNTISGGNVHRERVDGKVVRGTIHVTLKDKNGEVKADNLSVTPRSGTDWTVKLPVGVTIAEGDKVYVKQEFQGNFSDEVVVEAKQSLENIHKDKLTMPSGKIWIEDTSASLVNEDEQAEAIEMLKKANPDIASDFKSAKFSIDGTDHAYYEVTYTDKSTSGKIEATDLRIKPVTETSAAPTIEKVQVTDGQIIVTLEKEVAAGTKFYFIKEFTDGEKKNFCEGGNCKVYKSNPQEMSQEVSVDGQKVTFPINDKVNDLKLGREFGIFVKEPHKFRSCVKSEPVVTTPDKVDVRDPHKLTDADKKSIEKAIRDANTVNGKSKLPNSLEGMDYPAFIDFAKDGNARIIDPNYVKGEWDWVNYPDGKFIPEQNEDGPYKVKDEYKDKVISIPAKDLVKNIKPDAPMLALSGDKKNITITQNLADTDAKEVSVTYTDKKGTEQTITATKDKGGWTVVGDGATVDQNGVVTLPIKNAKAESILTATVTDAGGLTDEEKPLTSEKASLKLPAPSEYIVSFDGNGGSGAMESKNVKKGDEYTLPENGFTAPEGKEFIGWEINGERKAVGDKIKVESNVIVKALWNDKEVESYIPNKRSLAISQEEIEYNNHERYMYGYPDGTVRPEGLMTRAEAAALIARLAKLDMSNDAKLNFQDTESAWYNSAINAMTSKDLMFADKDGNFRPNQAITRAEFARALYGIDKKNYKVAPFADVKGHEFEAAINQAYGNGRINGYPDGTFKPDAYIQRSEAARILNQYANRGVDFDGLAGVRVYLIKFTDIDESHWAYYEIMEAANSHEYKRARGKQIETWLQILNK